MPISTSEINAAFESQWIGPNISVTIDHISIDSRSLQNTGNTLFFAITGPHYDAHDFIPELIEKGVRWFVVQKKPEIINEQVVFLWVENSQVALQKFATYYRKLFHFPVIGITGSNGKTTVKEWLNFLLNPEFNIIRSPKSYNSQVGVPLSILGINDHHNLGIFEAGISTRDEMKNLETIVQPNIGILTSIGSAHDEGFENMAEKIQQKLVLFQKIETLIYRKNKTIDGFLSPLIQTLSWSTQDRTADIWVVERKENENTILEINYHKLTFEVNIPFIDNASIENSMHCIATMLYFKYEIQVIQHRISLLFPIEMRLKVKKGMHNTTLIDDSYSADFQSLKIALDFLENQKQHVKKTLIISDIFQSGLTEDALYVRISQMVVAHKIHRVIAIGKTISNYHKKFINGIGFQSTQEFLEKIDYLNFENESILIKGARSYQFEKIVSFLEEKTHETVLEINLNAISHNLNYFKSKIAPKTKLMVMVKAFGYGNGGLELAKLLEYHKVDYLGVAFADEGIALKTNGIQLPIMVLNPESTSYDAIIQHELEPEIYSFRGLMQFIKTVKSKNKSRYPVHLKIDTGMHRLGFEENQIEQLLELITHENAIEIKSILSHLATSDDENDKSFALLQIERFTRISDLIQKRLKNRPILHIANTSGITHYPEAQFDMVRLGIGIYGISNHRAEQPSLMQVGTLKSVISQIRTIPKGDSVGYNRKFIAEQPTKIATIPIGYADGIRRSWGNSVGYVTINQQKAPIVGNICMDMMMVDVTKIDCIEGEKVIILGEQPSIMEMANAVDTISYEILTSISQRVKRIFFRE
jgi:alanine racemase